MCATIHCQRVETAHCSLPYFGGINPVEILCISFADIILAKHCFPYTEEGSFMVSGVS